MTSITIEPYWGNAVYVADQYYDVVYKNDFTGKQGVSQTGTQTVDNTTTFNGQKVRTSITGLGSGTTVYDNAVVLVGNFHLDNVPSNGTTPFTMMSVDEDNDHEPDYSLIYHHKGRLNVSPIRFDFLNVPGTSQAQRPNTASLACNVSIFKTKGWFEITNTALLYFSQFEYENIGNSDNNNNGGKIDGPLILQGGVFDQFVSTQSSKVNGKVYYIHVGGNVWFHEFGMGTHSDGSESTPHVPVSVTGGDYDGFYLTGTYNSNAAVRDDNAECYISGGRFKEVAAAAQEQLGGQKDNLTVATNNGNVHWQIYDADITEFYGGGVNDAKPVQGNIITDIFNSHVGTFCGGPKFGNMYANQAGTIKKTVTTHAEGCTFNKFFGAGYGGTSYTRKKYYDAEKYDFNSWQKKYYESSTKGDKGKYFDGETTNSKNGGGNDAQYGKKGPGVATDFDYEFFVWSKGNTGGRFFVKFASFSVAQCNDVESTLTGCTINDNFYGGGSLGKVTGTAKSVLDGCMVNGNVFGGGYSATLPSIEVRDAGFTKLPNYNKNSGMFEPATLSSTTTFTWKNISEAPANYLQLNADGTIKDNTKGSDLTNHYVYTDQDLTSLGQVGHTDLTIKGNTYVQGIIYKYGDDGTTVVSSELSGGVFGGGDESAVNGDTKVDIQGTAESGINNVYGGGNTADVDGSATVSVTGGKMADVYGGGRGETTTVKENVTVHIGKSFKEDGTTVDKTGSPSISGSVYGGSAFGVVNEDNAENNKKETKVNIFGGTIEESVYGGGKGQIESGTSGDANYKPAYAAQNNGDVTVNVEGGTVKTAVYGGSNANGVVQGDAAVTITGGTVGTASTNDNSLTDVVFGGGKGEPTLVVGDVTLNIGTQAETPVNTSPIIYGNVYGGSALGNTNVSRNATTQALDITANSKTKVDLFGGTIYGNVFGGGLGEKATGTYGQEGYDPGIESIVGGDVTVTLDGTKLVDYKTDDGRQIFGCNNYNGTPKGHVKVWVKRTVDSEKPIDVTTRPANGYDIAAVYGGGNQADYFPTKALSNDDDEKAKAFAEVLIDGCDQTSIEYVYGGGNAAAVPATDVTINGSYIIDQVFGGGNGAGQGNPGANVGIYKVNGTDTDYGTGVAATTLVGGKIHTVYGGSNTKGNVRKGTTLKRSESNSCPLQVDEIYGAGQEAPMDGDVNIVLECMPNDFVDQVFGGAKNATINGNVSLTVTSGKFGRVFGGNNEGGSINGSITVNAYEEGCEPLIIGALYGGGFKAPYSIYGCTQSGETWTANTEGTVYEGRNPESRADVEVNVFSCTSIGMVFGGGFEAPVIGNTHVWVNTMKGTVGDDLQETIGNIGQVFGGGYKGVVKGNTTIDVGTATVASDHNNTAETRDIGVSITRGTYTDATKGTYLSTTSDSYTDITEPGVYGGGYSADVEGDVTLNIGTANQNLGVNIEGNIYGGGYGPTTTVTGDVIVNIGKKTGNDTDGYTYAGYANITGDVYGGSAQGKVNAEKYEDTSTTSSTTKYRLHDSSTTQVNLYGGTIIGNVYGGGHGEGNHDADIYGNVTVNVEGIAMKVVEANGEFTKGRIFGGNNVKGSPKGTTTVYVKNTKGYNENQNQNQSGNQNGNGNGNQNAYTYDYHIAEVFGGGNQAAFSGTSTSVQMSGSSVYDVFGGGLGESATVNANTSVSITGGEVKHDVYGGGSLAQVAGGTSVTLSDDANIDNDVFGGGKLAAVQGAVAVTLNGGTVTRDVYGGGALAQTNTEYVANDDTKKTYTTTVNLGNTTAGATIGGNLYGGGLGQLAAEAVGESGTEGYIPAKDAVEADVKGPITVTVTKGLATNVFGCNNVNGSPKSTVTVNIEGTNAPTANRPLPIRNIYGGGNQAAYTYTDEAHPQNLQVNISGGTMDYVFGGGLSADVAGGIDVKVTGGTVVNDVYGGGALANTNTANWDASANSGAGDWKVDNSTSTDYYYPVKHLKAGESSVTGFYTKDGNNYAEASGTAAENVTYYKKLTYPAGIHNIAAYGTTYKTSVLLTGGTIGNAYGGGLGQLYKAASGTPNTEGYQPEIPDVSAMVYGDVDITVGDESGTAAFTDDVEYISGGSENVAKHGRVFGCNNLNGTPKGKVTVTINSTKRTDGTSNHVKGEFEIQGVYGGGNLADYVPQTYDKTADDVHTAQTEFGQKTRVIIKGCDNTSINKVYGGGNAASVPFTDVEIEGAFEIGYVFGGGNGGDKINKGSGWEANPGANVTHYANVLLSGGTIGQAFGGSDTKGTVGGADVKQETSVDCPLRIVNLYGAGNGEEANSEGDINITVSACGEGSEIQNVFGGSYKANIKGSVTLNITSGIFTSVYGGNDRLGSIGGNIYVNIEETGNCNKPIIIQNLYGGCYQTAYPGPNAQYKDNGGQWQNFTSGKITVNVKSATRIDRIFGGSENGAVTGDTEVNINMIQGSQSGHSGVALPSYYGEDGASIPGNITVTDKDGYVEVHGLVTDTDVAADHTKTQSSVVGYYTRSGEGEPYTYTPAEGLALANTTYYKKAVKGNIAVGIGTIGEVFGGGNRGNVSGNATVNIVTEPNVTMISETDNTATTDVDERVHPVLGAHITGDVYGGGNLADVQGKTYVNICAKENGSSVYEAVAEGTEHVTIGGSVYGGGKGADDNFFCDKGMVGVNNTNNGTFENVDKGTHIHIGNGKIGTLVNGALKAGTGNVYGGGMVGRVEFHSVVEVGLTPQTNSVTSAPEILGNVFGGGKGVETHGYAALLRGNTTVTVQENAKVRNSVYGGGEISTIGRFWIKNVNNKDTNGNLLTEAPPEDLPDGMPYKLRDGGKCTVSILGNAEIGPATAMTMPTFEGNVFGAGKGFLPKVYDYSADDDDHRPKRVAANGDDYFVNEAAYMVFIETQALADETHVNIGGNAFVKGSVYGGSENGRVLNDTHVNITGGQIGCSKNRTNRLAVDIPTVWDANYDASTTPDLECPSWEYESPFAPYDKFAQTTGLYDYSGTYSVIKSEDRRETTEGGLPTGSDGHTFYGNVFGGGSGKDPYAPGRWHRKAGAVGGDTYVNITGGHILTSVYGGNEHTDVGTYAADGLTPRSGGKCTVNMVGGTLGVPRTLKQIAEHPVTCYLFGAGKGDQRIFFNTWTNVISTEMNISGNARIFGSVFGGGEDGHVLGNAAVNIGDVTINDTSVDGANVKIGTTGTSYVDGNVFGGGRGFSGVALTAGSTGGNTTVNISDGKMLGSIYGGGRLASVGIDFTPPTDPLYGQLVDDTSDKTHGYITINISGGTIGNGITETGAGHPVSGNVFGGSMGRITLLDGETRIPLWPKLAVVKLTNVTISGGTIFNSVYGGSELGVVRNRATVNVSGTADIRGNVYGGGYGSDEQDKTTITAGGYDDIPTQYYTFTPMIWTGCVSGDTFVNISGGKIGKNVYGGGNFASVGLMNFNSSEDGKTYNYITKHESLTDGFGLSWPYEFQYIAHAPTDPLAPSGGQNAIGGKATVNITGGRIGTTASAGYGNVYGGSKGMVTLKKENNVDFITDVNEQRYAEAFCANVRETAVTVNYGSTPESDDGSTTACIVGAVYGGGQDGHVYEDANVTITKGLIGLSVYGGGQGESTFKGYLKNGATENPDDWKATTEDVHSITAGKVYGNTSVSMTGGLVVGHVYGGGNLASVGKGNYAGGADDYYPADYGEKLTGNLWASASEGDNAWHFLNSGNATVTITGGKVGTPGGTSGSVYGTTDATPTGMVFGGSRGRASEDIMLDPRHEYAPDFYLGYVNNTSVTIGSADGAPNIYSQVFGGGRDGHVRNNTHVVVNNGFIGQPYNDFESTEADDYQRYHRGNVYGSGSGLGQWTTGKHGMSSGSVTNKTTVDINGGRIYNNVYGGGAMASVGPPRIDTSKDYADSDLSKCIVNINGGTIGDVDIYNEHKYGGTIYGGSRGDRGGDLGTGESIENYATVLWTEVNINPHPSDRTKDAVIAGNVYGGARGGQVKKDTKVNLLGGVIKHNAYGGGRGTTAIPADVLGNTTVELNKGVADDAKGCVVDKVFGCNDLNGTPKRHATVHVYATQNRGNSTISQKIAPPTYNGTKGANEGYKAYLQRLINEATPTNGGGLASDATAITNANTLLTTTLANVDESALTDAQKKEITDAANAIIAALKAMHNYDVKAVYGGGDLAEYKPYGPDADGSDTDYKATTEKTEVIIEGCNVTSIQQVYGGGNAAPVPATDVLVKSCFIIDELFGGGNGLDNYLYSDNLWYENPGAHIGYKEYTHWVKTSVTSPGDKDHPYYKAEENEDADTPEEREDYKYGSGTATTTVNGGHIHTVYGGSNMKGNISSEIFLTLLQSGTCTMITDAAYASSKSAETDASSNLVLDCVEEGGTIFGGSYNANLNSDVNILITNGHYDKIFGGNDRAGTINGKISITIQESGCTPITIGELYGGGFLAPYSVYGYQRDAQNNIVTEQVVTDEKDDQGNFITVNRSKPLKKGDTGALSTPYSDPRINIVSATSIGKIFGGGYKALMVGSPHINVNMENGIILQKYAKDQEGYSSLTVANGDIDEAGNKILAIGSIGDIYGGGFEADVIGDTYVEIGTGTQHNNSGVEETITPARNAATITGNVFGGGKGKADNFTCDKAMVGIANSNEGSTHVTIGNGTVGTLVNGELKAGTGNVYGGGEVGRVEKNTSVTIGQESGTGKPVILGNVFGAGQGVNTHGYSGLTRGTSTVTVQGDAKVKGSVYGGGEMASVGKYKLVDGLPQVLDDTQNPYSGYCYVTIKGNAEIGRDDMKMKSTDGPDDWGHVFGAGKGVLPYEGYADDAQPFHWNGTQNIVDGNWDGTWNDDKKNYPAYDPTKELDANYVKFIKSLALATQTEVTIEGNAFVKGGVYGGAENGFVQRNTKVTIQGNCQIGNGYVQMDNDGNYLVTKRAVNRRYTAREWEEGHLFVENDPTFPLTEGENPVIADDTERALRTAVGTTNYSSSLPECASWLYQAPYAPYDKYADASGNYPTGSASATAEGGLPTGSDGHSFYGNVFGGGSGYYPYKPGRWFEDAGAVYGNTVVDIKGGHILTNVYGGNEMTNVEGNCTINMSAGTIGVPRTLGQIAAHPVTCYLFGGGKGDPRVLFNKETNVQDVEVNISGGWIYGSAFGGGEDGHVMRNVALNISGNEVDKTKTYAEAYADLFAGNATKIGTWGTSYVDGNVFGGGRGFAGDAYTAGNVAGSVTMTIEGGAILGSVYGGGRLGSVGYGLYAATETDGNNKYGMMQEDGYGDWYLKNNAYTRDEISGFKRGYVDITINGGTIGNEWENVIPNKSDDVAAGITEGKEVTAWTTEGANNDWAKWKKYKNIPNTEFVYDSDRKIYRLSHTKGGNVFTGGMGRMYQLDGTTAISAVDWWKLGNVKSTKLTINNGAVIKGNVYGGGELGMVQGTHTSADSKTVSTEIIINGGTIGTEIQETVAVIPVNEGDPTTEKQTRYTYGSVFGGGYGSIVEELDHTESTNPTYATTKNTYPKYIAGRVKGSTEVTMTDGTVKASVYGGGEMAAVGESKVLYTQHTMNASDPEILGETLTGANGTPMDGHTYVTVSGGTIGIPKVGDKQFGGATMGNVYGGGSGYINTVRSGQIYGNTNVSISGTPTIYHNVYGGGAYGSVGDFTYVTTVDSETGTKKVTDMGALHTDRTGTGKATVTITGGTIGVDGHEDGMIFGSSRGDVDEPGKRPDFLAWVNKTFVTIGTAANGTNAGGTGAVYETPLIKGSVYGSGENGHTYQDTQLNIHSGTIGDTNETYDTYYAYHGNVYGGGCGTDTYTKDGEKRYNPWAGIVRGNTEVNIDGGVISGSVYGAGAMASVGTLTNATDTVTTNGVPGKAKHYDIDNPGTENEVVRGFALSWPYEFKFAENTGKATINITGGHIGIDGTDGGDVYGSARGEAGERYTMAHYAFVKDAEVNVNFPSTASPSAVGTLTTPCITGSVHGSGENGYVYGDTKVTLNEGLISHSLYGAGKGIGTYKKMVPILAGKDKGKPKERAIYGLLSGKVLGNTLVTMNGGQVVRNVYGGGNMGSVGKGNFAGGADDYSTSGYGEMLEGNLWTSAYNPSNPISESNKPDEAYYFLNSGRANVRVLGGTVGDQSVTANLTKVKNGLPYGNVIGGSAGEAAPNVTESPRYHYCPAFFSGYVNETDVAIGGGYKCKAQCEDKDHTIHKVGEIRAEKELLELFAGTSVVANGKLSSTYWEPDTDGPTILASVYGGGQDGHVRRDTHVIVNSGTIGLAYNETNQEKVETDDLDNPMWLYRGNVFGGGSGVNKYEFDFDGDGETNGTQIEYGINRVTGGPAYVDETDYSTSAGSVTRFTTVEILGGTIHRNVYGGGSMGSVGAPKIGQKYLPYKKGDTTNGHTEGKQSQCTVIVGGAGKVVVGTQEEFKKHYGGEVYGACRGLSSDNEQLGTSIWTQVLVRDGAHIQGNVFGGGDAGMVKRDTDVIIGDPVPSQSNGSGSSGARTDASSNSGN